MNSNLHNEHNHKKPPLVVNKLFVNKKVIKPAFYAVIVLLLLITLYHTYFARRIIPGVMVGKTNVGGMSYNRAKELLESKEKNMGKVIKLKYNDYTYEIKADDISLEYDWDAAISRAFEVGRSGNFFIDNKDKIAGFLVPLYIPSFYELDNDSLSNNLLTIKGEVNKEAKNAQFVLNDKQLDISPSVEGNVLNDQELYNLVVNSFDNLDFSTKTLKTEKRSPDIYEKDLVPVKAQAEKVDLNKARFEAYLESLGQEVSELPRGNVTQMEGDRVMGFEITKSGKELDAKKFTKEFKDALFNIKSEVNIPMLEVSGNSDPEKYGIISLIGEGNSKFTGSAKARIHNLSLAAERTNGILVPPGGIRSEEHT